MILNVSLQFGGAWFPHLCNEENNRSEENGLDVKVIELMHPKPLNTGRHIVGAQSVSAGRIKEQSPPTPRWQEAPTSRLIEMAPC